MGKASAFPQEKYRTPTPNLTSRKTILNCFARQSPWERGKAAFTLAEVLITLGIIGVVAAMTLPALVGHYRKVEASSRLKKFVSSMEQAIRFSEAVNGDSKEWSKPATQFDNEGNIDYEAQGKVSKEFFMTYLAPYIKYTSIEDGKNTVDEDGNKSGTATTVYLADGSSFSFNNGGCMDIRFDINGVQKPNEFGKDRYAFVMCFSKSKRLSNCGSDKKAFCSYGTGRSGANNTRAKALADCTRNGYWCSSLLELDGWEFKEDYPYKL